MPTDWNNIDLPSEGDANLIDPMSFDNFLLAVNCNLPVIDDRTIAAEFDKRLRSIVLDARDVFRANRGAILKAALATRKDK